MFAGHRPIDVTGTEQVVQAARDRNGAAEKQKLMQARPTPMAAAAMMKRTIKWHANAVVESVQAAVLLELRA